MSNLPFRKTPSMPSRGLVQAGGPVDKSCIALCIYGQSLDPNIITARLGRSPTFSCRKGDIHHGPKYDRIEKTGKWHYDKPNSAEPIDVQIVALLDELNDNLDVWAELTGQFTATLAVGIFLRDWNQGFDLNAPVLQKLAERNISIWFDIYEPSDSEHELSND